MLIVGIPFTSRLLSEQSVFAISGLLLRPIRDVGLLSIDYGQKVTDIRANPAHASGRKGGFRAAQGSPTVR